MDIKRVCVTGASGFVASHIVRTLLERGYEVRGTVRRPNAPERYAYLSDLDEDGRLTLVGGDLLEDGSYDEAVDGCDAVMHTASPYVVDVDDPQRDLVDPAVRGTRNVLRACRAAQSVRRVVLTSSGAAITDEPIEGHRFTEEDWNEKSSLTRNAYYFSKTQAERAAWDFVESDEPGFDLVTMNPFLVCGPAYNDVLNTSNGVIASVMNGEFPAVVALTWAFVDVRDVAEAHVLAMEKPEASGRYLLAAGSLSLSELIEKLKALGYTDYEYPKLSLTGPIGTALAKLGSYMEKKGSGDFVRTHIGRRLETDASKAKRELGVEFRELDTSIRDAVEDMKRWGHIR
jgi:dihydroflavonol-4-reductase